MPVSVSTHTHTFFRFPLNNTSFFFLSNPALPSLSNLDAIPSCPTIFTRAASPSFLKEPLLWLRSKSRLFNSFILSSFNPPKYTPQFLSPEGNPNLLYSPTLSIIVQHSFPSCALNPRPTICRYLANERVGRAICMNSTSGQSNPSENKSTLTST